jgi:hypothetical protein
MSHLEQGVVHAVQARLDVEHDRRAYAEHPGQRPHR